MNGAFISCITEDLLALKLLIFLLGVNMEYLTSMGSYTW